MFEHKSENLWYPYRGQVVAYHLQTFQQNKGRPVFVFSDVPHNESDFKVADITEEIATEWCGGKNPKFKPNELKFYERLPNGSYHNPTFEFHNAGQVYKRTGPILPEVEVRERVTRGILYEPKYEIARTLSNQEWSEAEAPKGAREEAPKIEEIMKGQSDVETQRKKQGY